MEGYFIIVVKNSKYDLEAILGKPAIYYQYFNAKTVLDAKFLAVVPNSDYDVIKDILPKGSVYSYDQEEELFNSLEENKPILITHSNTFTRFQKEALLVNNKSKKYVTFLNKKEMGTRHSFKDILESQNQNPIDSYPSVAVENYADLFLLRKTLRKIVNMAKMNEGAILYDLDSAFIGPDVIIEKDAKIKANAIVLGNTVIKSGASIEENCKIIDSTIGEGTIVYMSLITNSTIGDNSNISMSSIEDSKVGSNCNIGPFAHIHKNSTINDDVTIGNFVEIKNTVINNGTKSKHLTYIGDTTIGKNVNIGAGVVVANYDGISKNKTVIEDGCFIGCNSTLVSPLDIEKNAYVAAGSTITKDIAEGDLAIGRQIQTNKEKYAYKKGLRKSKEE